MHSLFIHRGNKEQFILTGNSEGIISLNKALSNWYIENRYENYFQVLYMLVNLSFTFCDFRVMISNSNNTPAYMKAAEKQGSLSSRHHTRNWNWLQIKCYEMHRVNTLKEIRLSSGLLSL